MTDTVLDERYSQSISAPDALDLTDELAAIYRIWVDLRGDRPYPAYVELDWDTVPPDVNRWCAVVEVVQYPLDFVYSFLGENRTRLMGRVYLGMSVLDIRPAFVSNKILKEYVTVLERRAPIAVTTSGMGLGRDENYVFLRLPFGRGEHIEQILAVTFARDSEVRKVRDYFDGQPG